MARPYQPTLLRLLHAGSGLLALLAWFSGLVVYLRFDHRWFNVPLPFGAESIDVHGTIGVVLLPLAVLFAIYAGSAGRPLLRRASNLLPLLALALAIGTGKLMDEDWLRDQQFDHVAYSLHLLAWVLLTITVLWHGAAVLQRGGWPLVRSMASLRMQANDRPGNWPAQLLRGLGRR